MNILVAGCGKVGAQLAAQLSVIGHDVSVIGMTEESFDNLPSSFSGYTTQGTPIDRDVLIEAGIEGCDAFCAVTADDNVNIMSAQIAKEIFKVEQVFVRIYDPKSDKVFSSFGLYTVCPTNLTVSSIVAALDDNKGYKTTKIGADTVSFNTMLIPRELIGLTVSDIEYEQNEILYAIKRNGILKLVGLENFELEKNDILIFSKIID